MIIYLTLFLKKNFAKSLVIQNKAVSLHRNQKQNGYKLLTINPAASPPQKKRSYEKSKHSHSCCYCSVKP